MKMLICGGTGLVGHSLAHFWLNEGHEVVIVTRSKSAPRRDFPNKQPLYASWADLRANTGPCKNIDVVVNLAGETINQRWTESARNRITASRVVPARRLQDWASSQNKKLPLFISASGISIYGTSYTGVFDESSAAEGEDFLSHVVKQWEESADLIPAERHIKLRIAPVLTNTAGAFPPMLLPFKLFFGGPIGSGKQPFSWIHIDDLVRMIDFIVMDSTIDGIVNASSPETVTNEQFGRTLGKVYNRPFWFRVPAWVLKIVFGEMSTLLLEGQRVYPAKALEHGFTFQYGTVENALRALRHDRIAKKEAPVL
ncbi:TIGR01777 family oxidoreductase [Paenibacillus marinisediminis]